jgi:hypothetical protein
MTGVFSVSNFRSRLIFNVFELLMLFSSMELSFSVVSKKSYEIDNSFSVYQLYLSLRANLGTPVF